MKRSKLKILFLVQIALLAILCVSPINGYSQKCNLSITAYSGDEVIEGIRATISNAGSKQKTTSDAEGGFRNLKRGKYTLRISKAGYKTLLYTNFFHDCRIPVGIGFYFNVDMEPGKSSQIAVTRSKETSIAMTYKIATPEAREISMPPGVDEDVKKETPPQVPENRPAPPALPKFVSGGVVNGKATYLPKPDYPPAAKAVRASGAVNVQVMIDENGNVISASAVSGHPLLRAAAESVARQAKFSPTLLSGQKVKVSGVVVYNFTAPKER